MSRVPLLSGARRAHYAAREAGFVLGRYPALRTIGMGMARGAFRFAAPYAAGAAGVLAAGAAAKSVFNRVKTRKLKVKNLVNRQPTRVRKEKRKASQGAITQGNTKKQNTDWGDGIKVPFNTGTQTTTPARNMNVGPSYTGRPAQLGVLRKRRARSRRRPTRKRSLTRRIKKVVADISEQHYLDCPVTSLGTNATGEFAPQSVTYSAGTCYDTTNNRYEFGTNFPHMGFLRLCMPDHLPAYGTKETPNTYSGQRVDITGYSISGVVEIDAAALTQAYVKIHVVTMNTNKFPPKAAVAGVANGWETNYSPTLLTDRSSSHIIINASAPPTITGSNITGIVMLDTYLGDRHRDVDKKRVGIFNHGFKLMPGWNIKTTVVIDRRRTTNANNLSNGVFPFKFFVPVKKTFKDLVGTTAERNQQMMAKMPYMFVATEICELDKSDSTATGAKVCFNTPRLHFKDHI